MAGTHASLYAAVAAIVAMTVLLSGGLLLHSAMPEIASGQYTGQHYGGSAAAISVLVVSQHSTITDAVLTLAGNGVDRSVRVVLSPGTASANESAITGMPQGAIPRAPINESNAISVGIPYPYSEAYDAFFGGLRPYSTYTLTLNGSARPYCAPGLACPMFILRVFQQDNVSTGAAGTIARVVIGPPGVVTQGSLPNLTAFNTYPQCGGVISGSVAVGGGRTVSLVTCYANQRLLNFLVRSVNANGTVTVYSYPYMPVAYEGQEPSVITVRAGQEAGYTCPGYIAYLNATDYAAGAAVFKLVKGPPIPCPV